MKKSVLALVAITQAIPLSALAASDNLLREIKDRGVMHVCMADYYPYAIKNPVKNTWEGLDIDIAHRIAQTMGVNVEFVDAPWPVLLQSLVSAKCDVSMAPSFVVPERAEQVLFSNPFAYDSTGVFVGVDTPINSLEELDAPENIVVFTTGTAEDRWARGYFKKAQLKPLVGDSLSGEILEVAAGRATAVVTTRTGAKVTMDQNPQFKFREITEPILPTPFAFMLPKGEYHFQQYLNVVLNRLESGGELRELGEKWGIAGSISKD